MEFQLIKFFATEFTTQPLAVGGCGSRGPLPGPAKAFHVTFADVQVLSLMASRSSGMDVVKLVLTLLAVSLTTAYVMLAGLLTLKRMAVA